MALNSSIALTGMAGFLRMSAMFKSRSAICFLLLLLCGYTPGLNRPLAESEDGLAALEEKLQSSQGPERLSILFQLSDVENYFSGGKYILIANDIMQTARQLRDEKAEVRGMRVLGHGYYTLGDNRQALTTYFSMRLKANTCGYGEGAARANQEIAYIMYFCYFDYPRAIDYLQKALAGYRKVPRPTSIIKCLNDLGDCHRLLQQDGQAVTCYLEALQLCNTHQDAPPLYRAALLWSLITMNREAGNQELAGEYLARLQSIDLPGRTFSDRLRTLYFLSNLEAFQRNFAKAIHHNREVEEAIARWSKQTSIPSENLSRLQYSQKSRLGIIYYEMGDWPAVVAVIRQALACTGQGVSQQETVESHLLLARAYMKLSQPQLALPPLKHCREVYTRLSNLSKLGEVYQELATVHLSLKDPERALECQRRWQEARENSKKSTTPAAIVNLIYKFEKERFNEKLRESESRQHLFVWSALALIVSGLAAGAFIFYRLRRVQQWARREITLGTRQLEEKKSELERVRHQLAELEAEPPPKYGKSGLTPELAQHYLKKLIDYFERDKPYLDPETSLESVAKQLNLNRTYVSQIINDRLGCTFTGLINRFRLDEAKKKLDLSTPEPGSILEIAMETGFNSKSNFYLLFKKYTGLTPRQYVEKNRRRDTPARTM